MFWQNYNCWQWFWRHWHLEVLPVQPLKTEVKTVLPKKVKKTLWSVCFFSVKTKKRCAVSCHDWIKIQKSRSKNPKIKIQKWLPRHPCPHILVPEMNLSNPCRVDKHPLNLNSHRLWQISRVLLLFDEKNATHMVLHTVWNFANFCLTLKIFREIEFAKILQTSLAKYNL